MLFIANERCRRLNQEPDTPPTPDADSAAEPPLWRTERPTPTRGPAHQRHAQPPGVLRPGPAAGVSASAKAREARCATGPPGVSSRPRPECEIADQTRSRPVGARDAPQRACPCLVGAQSDCTIALRNAVPARRAPESKKWTLIPSTKLLPRKTRLSIRRGVPRTPNRLPHRVFNPPVN